MQREYLYDIFQKTINIILILSFPVLFSVLITGFLISIFQALTQINEQTLSFIPKLIAIFLVFFLLGTWMLDSFIDYVNDIFLNLPVIIDS